MKETFNILGKGGNMSKKVLITGANGCVGCEIVRLLRNNYKIIAVDKANDNLLEFGDSICFKNLDITNVQDIESCFNGENINLVIHLAAKVHTISQNEQDIQDFFIVNTEATKTIFDLCVKNKVQKIIFFSTSAVYGTSTGLLDETSPVFPVTTYAKSKYEAEIIGQRMVKENGLPLIILRPATIYGKYDRGNYNTLIKLVKKGLSVIPGNGDNFKSVIYVKDVARIVERFLNQDCSAGEVFIISEGNYKLIEIIKSIETSFEVKSIKIRIPLFLINWLNQFLKHKLINKLKTLSDSICLNNNKAIGVINYKPNYDFSKGLNDCKKFYK